MISELTGETPEGARREQAAEHVAESRRALEMTLVHYARRLEEIQKRLDELDGEWHIDRTVQLTAGLVTLAGLTLGLFGRKWLILPAMAAGCLLRHAFKGWSPPAELLHQLGMRSLREIDRERYALKALRGDFRPLDIEPEADVFSKADKVVQATEAG